MNEKIMMNDQEFEKYIRVCLKKETGEITVQDMEQIEYLDLGHVIFHDISAVKHCKNLREISFAEDFSQKYDLSILKTLHHLKSVSLFNPKDTECRMSIPPNSPRGMSIPTACLCMVIN